MARPAEQARNTVNIANEIQNVNGVTALAHLTCVNSNLEKIKEVLGQLEEKGIENVLALRGDLVEGSALGEFRHASQLAELIRKEGFCVGGACYPEGHPGILFSGKGYLGAEAEGGERLPVPYNADVFR